MDGSVERMLVGNSILDLSNVVCPVGEQLAQSKGAVFLVLDFEHYNQDCETEYCQICWGEDVIEDCCIGLAPAWLAIRRQDGTYWLERAEQYIEARETENRLIERALDLRKLPGELGGIRLQTAEGFHVTPGTRGFNRWRTGFFRSGGSQPEVWRFEETRPEE